MQSLWSRAGQAHRCGCKACDTVMTGLGRRASTAAQRRKPTFAEVFTACYSSVFATAAVVDAFQKEDRRQNLDRQLDETRRELADLQQLVALESSRSTAIPDDASISLTLEQMDPVWKRLKDVYASRPFMKEIHKPVALRISEDLDRMKNEHYKCPDQEAMNAARKTKYEDIELAMLAEEMNRFIYHRSSKSKRQLHNDSRVTMLLINQLLRRAETHDKSSSPSPSFDKARQLAEQESLSYTFTYIDPKRVRQTTAELNKHLREIVSSTTLSLKEKVGRVCYNLLVSPYTPSMHTYNTLILAFDKDGHSPMAEPFVNTFFHYTRLRPTPSTFVAILNHYKVTNNHGKFLRALACITGIDTETGAKMKRRNCEDVVVNKENYFHKAKWRTQTGDWVWDHLPLTLPMVESIFDGLLHFKLFDQAAILLPGCMKGKVNLSADLVKRLFDEVIVALDWRAAVRLVRNLSDYEKKWPHLLLERDSNDVAYLIDRVHVLLDICGLSPTCYSDSDSMLLNLGIVPSRHNRFLEALEKAHEQVATDSISNVTSTEVQDAVNASKSRLLQIESMWKEQAFIARTRLSVESKLLSPDFSPQFRSSMALHIGQSATQESLSLNQEFIEIASELNVPQLQESLVDCEAFRTSMEADVQPGDAIIQSTLEAIEEAEGVEEEVLQMTTQFEKMGPLQSTSTVSVEGEDNKRRRLRDRPESFFSWSVPQPTTQTQRAAAAYS